MVDERLINVPGSTTRLILWEETDANGVTAPFYAISLDGKSIATVRETSYVLKLRHGDHDPAVFVPSVDTSLAADDATNLYFVQFVTQPLEEFRRTIEELGGVVHKFISNHTYITRMTPDVHDTVADLPFVRWVGPVHPAYKLEEEIRGWIGSGEDVAPRLYSIMLCERGVAAQDRVSEQIHIAGGKVQGTTPKGFRIEAIMPLSAVVEIAALDDVLFIDRKGEIEFDMDIVREIGGADYLEGIAGFTGQGVRAEVADSEIDVDHQEWSAPPIIHLAGSETPHGTSVYGILFAQGVVPQARGLIPDGVGIFAASSTLLGGGPTRYTHTEELVDPDGPYRAVLQTNSTGDPRTYYYTTISAEMDDILFLNDIAITQSQSNAGSQDSRPQAWAKNIISGGAVEHYDTLTRDDDCWCYSGSIGPADDGRIKPDLCFFYDYTYAPSSGGGYTEFGGTSGATPSIAGHVCLFFQMWSEGIFGNDVDPDGTVFENRCHMTTAKAAVINTANQYPFTGTSHDLTRMHQGWGMPDVRYLYDMRENMSFMDETELLENMDTVEYVAFVELGEPELRVTMIYADPPGVPNASQHRINDLTLKLTSPSDVVYWGNNGLLEGNYSTPGGGANTIDTVENVFILNPEAGVWSVEIIASEVNEDGHLETPELDADFALVVSGAFLATCTSDGRISLNGSKYACDGQVGIRVVDCDLNQNDELIETTTVTIDSSSEPDGETVLLTETGPQTSDFRGTITLSDTDGEGILLVAHDDLLTTTYIDADDGLGGTDVEVTDTAVVDCVAPIISNVATTDIEPRSATSTFDTDEDAKGTVRYGLSCLSLNETAGESGFSTEHSVNLTGLSDATAYFYAVDVVDRAGNMSTDDNGGICYMFTTPDIPDFFTEVFGSDNDLDNVRLEFVPNASDDFYAGCVEEITELPTDPTGGTSISLSDDDSEQITLGSGATVLLYDTSYSTFHVSSNGYVTFTSGDTDYTESLEDHFSLPRIAGLFDDLNPSSGGSVSWRQLADRAVVTWENVPEYSSSNSNTFQIEMFFDGTITISYLEIAASDGLAGLSEGEGLDPDYFESDLSAMGPCGEHPPTAFPVAVSGPVSAESIAIGLDATDDGMPDPPGAITFKVMTLPDHGDLYEDADLITSVPHELADYGYMLTYVPEPGYDETDTFQFIANDGGIFPEGGDSNTAPVTITLGGPEFDPVAHDVSASTPLSTPVNVTLNATDPNGDPLTYFVSSLPAEGTLSDPNAGQISSVPYELAAGGQVVEYTPPNDEYLTADFDYYAEDFSATSNTATATVTVGGPAWDPVADDVTVATAISTDTDITLDATDPNGDPLTYVIDSLPDLGSLSDPGAGDITSVPYTLVDGGDVVHYTPPWNQNLLTEFDYHAEDATAASNIAMVAITVGGSTTVFLDDFETDMGWTVEDILVSDGSWERGIPAGDGTRGDPLSDYDGSGQCYVTGIQPNVDLDGGPTRLTSPVVDLSRYADSMLSYARWFNNDDLDEDRIDVLISANGGDSWALIESVPHFDGWVERTIAIEDFIAPTSEVLIRFAATDNPNNSITEGGIDAIEIWGMRLPSLLGDYDDNGVIDLDDFAYFVPCMTGPAGGPLDDSCRMFDFDTDDDVDAADFAAFQEVFDGGS